MLRLSYVGTVGCLIVALMLATHAVAVETDAAGPQLLVPIEVVEPSLWLIEPSHIAQSDEAIRVSYGELDLATEAGVSGLYARLQDASEKVCGHAIRNERSVVSHSGAHKLQCISGVLSQAVANIDLPRLDKKHAG